MISLLLSNWKLALIALLTVALAGTAKVASHYHAKQLETQARFDVFVEQTRRLGEDAKAKAEEIEKTNAAMIANTEKAHAKDAADIRSRYERTITSLRNRQSNSRSGDVPRLSEAAGVAATCTGQDADAFARRLDEFEARLLAEVLQPGDAEIEKFGKLWNAWKAVR